MILDAIGFLLLAGLLAFGAWALWKPLRALWGLTSRRPPSERDQQALDWWTKKPYPPIVRGKRGGRYQRVYSKRTGRSYKRYLRGRF